MARKSKPAAPPVDSPAPTPTRKPGPPRNPRNRKNWPKYSPEQQALLSTFLGAWLATANNAVVESRKVARGTPPDHPARRTLAYWENVCSGISWLADKVPARQQHLLVADLVERGELTLPGDEPCPPAP